jgi:hypothetical protein
MFRQKTKLIALACLALGAAASQAGTLTFNSYADGSAVRTSEQAINLQQNGGSTISLNGDAAGYNVTFVDAAGVASTLTTFCIDLDGYAGFAAPTAAYTIIPASASPLLTAAMTADIGKLYTVANANGNSIDTQSEFAAMQIDIWEIEYEGSVTNPHSLSTGNLTVGSGSPTSVNGVAQTLASASTLALAQSWLDQLPTATSTYDVSVLDHGLSRLSADTPYQDQVFATPMSVTTPVPEPSTYALMLAGLAAAGCVARRRTIAKR